MATLIHFAPKYTTVVGAPVGGWAYTYASDIFDVTAYSEIWADIRVYGHTQFPGVTGLIETTFSSSFENAVWTQVAITNPGLDGSLSKRLHATGLGSYVRAKIGINAIDRATVLFGGVARNPL